MKKSIPTKKIEILLEEAFKERKYRPVAVAIIVDNEEKILLVRSAKNPRQWYFPQGGIENGESVVSGLFREMKEELGLGRNSLKFVRHLGVDDLDAEAGRKDMRGFTRGKRYFFFLMAYARSGEKIEVDRKEIIGYKWVKIKSVPKALSSTRKSKKKLVLEYLRKI